MIFIVDNGRTILSKQKYRHCYCKTIFQFYCTINAAAWLTKVKCKLFDTRLSHIFQVISYSSVSIFGLSKLAFLISNHKSNSKLDVWHACWITAWHELLVSYIEECHFRYYLFVQFCETLIMYTLFNRLQQVVLMNVPNFAMKVKDVTILLMTLSTLDV